MVLNKQLNKDSNDSMTGSNRSGAPERRQETIDSHITRARNIGDAVTQHHTKEIKTGKSIRKASANPL
jgi:hypothetical protein